ncbi:MAG TPA: ATP synthase F1 subunit delta [Nitrospiraceae bacterium]|nr:ATP synthase F1 subunit delta [Nitrospiraceae bacterium]
MIKTAVARRYAKALFDLLDQPSIEPANRALHGLGQAFTESAALRHIIASPAFAEQDKLSVLLELADRLGCPPVGKNFLDQLVRKNRVAFLPDIAEAFTKLLDEAKGREQVTVSSATALPSQEQDRIRMRLRDVLKRDVDVTFQADAAHVAGLHIRLGSTVVDSTIQGRFTAMQRLLTKE